MRLGDIDLSTDREPSAPVTFKVTEVRAHPRFSRVGFYNDIAVLVLDRPVRKSKYVIPVCLPKLGKVPSKERLPGQFSILLFSKRLLMKIELFLRGFQGVVRVSLAGAPHTTAAKNQQCNVKPNYQFGEMKTVIELIINR